MFARHFLVLTSRVEGNRKTLTAGFNETQLLATLHVYLCRLCPVSSGTELSAVYLASTFT
jgi:hypothetical protein